MSLSINPKFLSGLITTDEELLKEAQIRQLADADLRSSVEDEVSARQVADTIETLARQTAIQAETEAREAAIEAEAEAREIADAAESIARQESIRYVNDVIQTNFDIQKSEISDLKTSVQANSSAISSEISTRIAADIELNSKIDTEKSRIDAILSASDADKDSFVEIVSLINSIDTTNDQAFAGYVSSNNARVSEVESDLAQETLDRQSGDSALSDLISQETSSRISADTILSASIAQEVYDRETAVTAEASSRQLADESLQSQIDTEKSRIDAILSASDEDRNSFAEISALIESSTSSIEASLALESSTRQLADENLQSQIDELEESTQALRLDVDELDENVQAIRSEVDLLESSISSESSSRQLADENLQSQIYTEKSRIDAILSASDADKDSFVEIVSLINSIDTTNDQAFAGYVSSNNARVSEVESDLAQETLDRQSGDSALSQRITPIEEILEFEKAIAYENNSAVYADAQPGKEDESLRPGWYYKNTTAGQKINWYFFDGVNQANVSLGDFSAYAVMTFDSVSPVKSPILAVYTMPTGTNDVMPGFAHSRVIYSGLSSTPVAGKKYLVYFGQNPAIHPELPRIQLAMSTANSVGEKSPSERVLTSSFGSNSSDAVNTVQFMVEKLGISSPSFKGEVELKIRPTSLKKLEDITSRLAAIEGGGFSNGNVTVGLELSYIDLDRQYTKLTSISVGRLAIHEGEDFTVSIVNGKTRLTWINSLAASGDQAIQAGDRIFFIGAY